MEKPGAVSGETTRAVEPVAAHDIEPAEHFFDFARRELPDLAATLDGVRGSMVFSEATLRNIVDAFAQQNDREQNSKLEKFLLALGRAFDDLHEEVLFPMKDQGLIDDQTFELIYVSEGGDKLARVGDLVGEHPEFKPAYNDVLKTIASRLRTFGLDGFRQRYLSSVNLPEPK